MSEPMFPAQAKAELRRDLIQYAARVVLDTLSRMGDSAPNLDDAVFEDMGIEDEADVWHFDGEAGPRQEEFYDRLNALHQEILLECLHQSIPYYGRPRQ